MSKLSAAEKDEDESIINEASSELLSFILDKVWEGAYVDVVVIVSVDVGVEVDKTIESAVPIIP